MHHLECDCGKVQGQVTGSGPASRLICYCKDCQAFARYLGDESRVLDAQGGSEMVQLAQQRLEFTQGQEHLACMRMSPKGPLRWYTSCCKTPLGATAPSPKMAFIGLVHPILDKTQLAQDFGTSIGTVHVEGAIGEPKPEKQGLVKLIWTFVRIGITGRWLARKTPSPLFKGDTPLVEPTVITREERARLKQE